MEQYYFKDMRTLTFVFQLNIKRLFQINIILTKFYSTLILKEQILFQIDIKRPGCVQN